MPDPAVIRSNERWKPVSRTMLQFGTVLASAATIEVYRADAVTLETAGWLIAAAGLMHGGWKVLILLDSES